MAQSMMLGGINLYARLCIGLCNEVRSTLNIPSLVLAEVVPGSSTL